MRLPHSLNRQFIVLVGLACVWLISSAGVGFAFLIESNRQIVTLSERQAESRAMFDELQRLSQQLSLYHSQTDGTLDDAILASLRNAFDAATGRAHLSRSNKAQLRQSWQTLLSIAASGGDIHAAAQHLGLRLHAAGRQAQDRISQARLDAYDARQRGLLLTAAAVLIGVLVGAWLVLRQTRKLSDQLHALGRGMAVAAAGDLSQRVSLHGCSELEALSAGFNYMADELESQGKALRVREQGLLTVMNSAPDAIITLDLTGRVISWNGAAERLSAYSAQEMRNAPLQTAFDPGQHADIVRILDECRDFHGDTTDEAAGPWELTIRRKDGLHRPVELTLRDMDSDGERALVAIARDITERKAAAEKMAFLTQHDSLTQLPNRALLRDLLVRAMNRARHGECLVGVMSLGVNRFSDVNDNLGHALGDALLIAIAQRLSDNLSRQDYIGRIGGDEFCIVLGAMRHVDEASALSEKLTAALAEPFRIGAQDVFATLSMGVTIYPFDDGSPEVLLKHASAAMYRCKRDEDSICLFYTDEMNRLSTDRVRLTAELKRAVEAHQFHVYYQPLLEAKSGRVLGAEALLRWKHPQRGMLAPADFLELLQDTGLILHVGRDLMEDACRQSARWIQQGLTPFKISINLSARQFAQPGFSQDVHDMTTAMRAELSLNSALGPDTRPLDCLEFELTEDVLMEHTDDSLNILLALKEQGITLSVDDFGTGYSSLSYLKQFPIDALKIDQSFVRDIGRSQDAELIVHAIIDLAHNLRMKVVGEGVETEQQLAFLREKGCDVIQGYLYGPPMPADAFEEFLRSHRAPPSA